MMIPGLAPSTPASHEPFVLTTLPFLYSFVSSPKYHTELAFFPSPVIDHHTLYSHYHLGGVGDSHLVALSFPLVDEGGARLHGEIFVVDFCGELGGIYMWSVSLVLLRGSLLLRGTFVLLRGGGVGAPRHEYQHRG